jgi:hypothetical protein
VPEGISVAVHADVPLCVGAVDGAEAAVVGAAFCVVAPPAEDGADVEPDADVETEPAPGLAPGLDADVLPTELVLPNVDPPLPPLPAFLADVLLEHPAVSAAAPSAPAATNAEIRFMEPNLSG